MPSYTPISLRKGIDFKFNATIDRIEKGEDGKLHIVMNNPPGFNTRLISARQLNLSS